MNSPLFQTLSIRSYSISYNLSKVGEIFWDLNTKRPYLILEKESFCAAFAYSIKRAREIRKFQVADLQRRLRNVQKRVMHLQSCRFTDINRLLFCRSRSVAVVFAKAPHCCDLKMLLPW